MHHNPKGYLYPISADTNIEFVVAAKFVSEGPLIRKGYQWLHSQ